MNTYHNYRPLLTAALISAVEGGIDVTGTYGHPPKRAAKASRIERARAAKKRAAKQARKRQRKAK